MTDELRQWWVYGLYHPLTDELRYVGKTIDCDERLYGHLWAARNDIKTYCCNWIRSLLRQELEPVMKTIETGYGDGWADAERYWIRYHRNAGARLTNMTDGGEGMLGHVHSVEHRNKIRLTSKNRTHSDIARQRISDTRDNKIEVRRIEDGIVFQSMTAAAKEMGVNITAIHYAIQSGGGCSGFHWEQISQPVVRNIKPIFVRRIEDGVIFPSISAAAKEIDVSSSAMIRAIRKRHILMNYHWEHIDTNEINDSLPLVQRKTTSIRRIEDDIIFDSVTEAAESIGVLPHNIHQSLKYGGTCGTYHWERVDITDEERKARPVRRPYKTNIRCVETGKEFESMADAAKALGLNSKLIRYAAEYGGEYNGYHWEYANITDEERSTRILRRPPEIEVRRIEDGFIFKSMTDAAKAHGVVSSAIYQAVKYSCMSGGYHWERTDITEEERMNRTFPKQLKVSVRRVEDGMIFNSMIEAANAVGAFSTNIASAIERQGTCKGYHWERVISDNNTE